MNANCLRSTILDTEASTSSEPTNPYPPKLHGILLLLALGVIILTAFMGNLWAVTSTPQLEETSQESSLTCKEAYRALGSKMPEADYKVSKGPNQPGGISFILLAKWNGIGKPPQSFFIVDTALIEGEFLVPKGFLMIGAVQCKAEDQTTRQIFVFTGLINAKTI